jgi:hypothetical protein
MFGEDMRSSLRVSLALAPTLIFTLVLAGLLRERFHIPDALFGALLLYAALTTLLPSLVFRTPFDVDPMAAPEADAASMAGDAPASSPEQPAGAVAAAADTVPAPDSGTRPA